jgi:Flp pilus assembly protein protease CpaA
LQPASTSRPFRSLAAGAVVLAIGFACFAFGWIGGGDAKFAAVIALWLGLGHVLEFLVTSAVFGGVLTIAILTFRRSGRVSAHYLDADGDLLTGRPVVRRPIDRAQLAATGIPSTRAAPENETRESFR